MFLHFELGGLGLLLSFWPTITITFTFLCTFLYIFLKKIISNNIGKNMYFQKLKKANYPWKVCYILQLHHIKFQHQNTKKIFNYFVQKIFLLFFGRKNVFDQLRDKKVTKLRSGDWPTPLPTLYGNSRNFFSFKWKRSLGKTHIKKSFLLVVGPLRLYPPYTNCSVTNLTLKIRKHK